MKADLLNDLCCPETHQPLRVASGDLLAALHERLRAGELRNRAGDRLEQHFEAGLLREDGKLFYPVRNGLPILLIAEAIPVGVSALS